MVMLLKQIVPAHSIALSPQFVFCAGSEGTIRSVLCICCRLSLASPLEIYMCVCLIRVLTSCSISNFVHSMLHNAQVV